MSKPNVLFLCTGNSARSQMGEALLRHVAGDRFDAYSAGLEPKGVHPLTYRVLEEKAIATGTLESKSVKQYLGRLTIHHAMIVCAHAHDNCPVIYPFALRTHYWPFDDPAAPGGSEEARLEKFREVRDQIAERISRWLDEVASESR